ncbi:MAG: hypothetical protein R3E76_04735 [Planctomycetota bacterium]
MALISVGAVTALMLVDVSVIYAHRPPIYVQGQGQECECVWGVVFPSTIASRYDSQGQLAGGGPYGTGAWFKHWQNDPVGWSPFLDEDNLWIKTKCQPGPNAENPVEPVIDSEEAWELETTQSDPWWEGSEYDEWKEEVPDPDQEEQQFYPGFEVHCPCQILVKWLGTDGNSGSYVGLSPKMWQWLVSGAIAEGVAANVLPGEQVTITVRMICGDCVLELVETATMAAAP